MILLIGVPSEPPIRLVSGSLDKLGLDYYVWNGRDLQINSFEGVNLDHGKIGGCLTLGDFKLSVEKQAANYARPLAQITNPKLHRETLGKDKLLQKVRELEYGMSGFLNTVDTLVINRPSKMWSNNAKLIQARYAIKHGFRVPRSHLAATKSSAREIVGKFGRAICKSQSGERSTVFEVVCDDFSGEDEVFPSPVLIQEYVTGIDVRVHVVGDSCLSCAVFSEETDYRYSSSSRMAVVEDLGHEVQNACVALTKDLGLVFSGIDLRVADSGEIFCFEVNPSPGYSYFEYSCGLPIARELANLMARATGRNTDSDT